VPEDRAFWDYLLDFSRPWGLVTYEQDWLHNEFENLQAMLQSATLGRQWLLQMGEAAASVGLTIQYCMAYPRHYLQSAEIPAVTQIRVSDDYQPGNDQWKIGLSSILAYSLGLASFKDNFWTTTHQPGNPYNKSEPFPRLQSAVATLSADA